MLRMTGSAMLVNGVAQAGVQAPAVRQRPWEARGRIDVEALVEWAFQDQRVASAAAGLNAMEARASGLEWQERSTCGCARMESIGLLDARVDVSPGQSHSDVHPAAEAVMACIEASAARDVLMPWARWGSKPGGWAVPARWVEPMNGWVEGERFQRAAPIYDLVGGAAGGQRRALPIQVRDPGVVMGEVAARREVYAAWWLAVAGLAFDLSLLNLGFVVDGPVSPSMPWADAVNVMLMPASVVLPDDGVVLWVARWDALSEQMVRALGAIEGHGVIVVDVDEVPDLAIAMDVRALPTAMVLRGVRPVVNTVGVQNERALRRWLQRAATVGA